MPLNQNIIQKIQDLQQENQKLKETNKAILKASGFIEKIQELQQNKTYIVTLNDAEEAKQFRTIIEQAKRETPWTLPQFILISKPIEELDINKLKKILELRTE